MVINDPQNGEDSHAPFLVVSALVDLGSEYDYQNKLHRRLCTALMEEVMGTAAFHQTSHGALEFKYSVTYGNPSISMPRIVVVCGRVVKVVGCKIYARATIKGGDGTIIAEENSYWVKAN